MKSGSADEAWLHGYSIGGIGGIALDAPVRVGPLAKMNFLVGRNNHGKSTVLRAAAQWTDKRSRETAPGKRETLVPVHRKQVRDMLSHCGVRNPDEVDRKIQAAGFSELDSEQLGLWIERSNATNTSAEVEIKVLGTELRKRMGVSNYAAEYPGQVYPHFARQTVFIPAFREMRAPAADADSQSLASGAGLVAELSKWERPTSPGTAEYNAAKQRWARLRSFIRDVLEDPEAELEIAEARDLHVRLAQAKSMLHIDSLGDGVKQVLMIAAACINFDDHLVLLEEPEIHLHAGLQRKLMKFLQHSTSSQYLIATHSAHVLDLPGARIFHVTHDGHSTRIAHAVRASDVQQVCLDLGYMASDLLQANYTIWVEGPSDRVYWRRWLELVDGDLVEGVHFSIMSYGGYLIDGAHLLDQPDPATEDLVQLLKLGRQCVVIADSDKTSRNDKLRPTLKRLIEESEQPGSGDIITCNWVRTVENHIPRKLFRDTVIGRHPRAGRRLETEATFELFDRPFDGMKLGTYSKVAIAQDVAAQLKLPDIDKRLKKVLVQLASAIRSANGLPAIPR